MSLLIPYGLSNETDEIVEPEDARRGRACYCRCPGCAMPLVSRHPKDSDKRIHFAHDTKHPSADINIINNCPFNGLVAIRFMAQHLATSLSGRLISLPGRNMDTMRSPNNINTLTIDSAESKILKIGQIFDLKLTFKGQSILVWLEYKTRHLPRLNDEQRAELGNLAILRIDVRSFNMDEFALSKQSFSAAVLEFLLCGGVRQWGYHPKVREQSRSATLQNTSYFHANQTRGNEHGIQAAPHHPQLETPQRYECVLCHVTYMHYTTDLPDCPNGCGKHYGRKL